MPFEVCHERPYGRDLYRVSAKSSDDEIVAIAVDLVTADGEVRRVGDLTIPFARVAKVRAALNETLREIDEKRPKVLTLDERRKEIPASHLAWTPDEENELLREFDAGENEDEMARRHKRSVVAIRSRLVKLGRLEDWHPTTPVA